MIQTIRQWISRAIALGVIGPAASILALRMVSVDGSSGHTLLGGVPLVSGVITLLGVCVLVAVMGLLGTALGGRREGLLGMGFVLGWVAWTGGRLGRVYLLVPESGTMVMLMIETVVLILTLLVVGSLISREDQEDRLSSFNPKRLGEWFGDMAMLGACGGALVAGLGVSWLFGQNDLPGQSIGVGFFAGILGGVVGAMIAGSMHDKDEHTGTPYAPVMIGVMLCGVVAPLLGLLAPGVSGLPELVISGSLPGYLIVSPAGWVAGALIGVPLGHSWVEHSHARMDESARATS